MTSTLTNYLDEVRRLIHDPSDLYVTQADKTANINTAMQRRDADTGANRTLISFTLTARTDNYTFTQLGNTRVFDVVGINVLYNGNRLILRQMSFTKLNSLYRVWTGLTDVPVAFARFGSAKVYLGPAPSLAYSTEWDCCVVSTNLSAVTDTDALPYPFTEPVPYWAAYLCKFNQRMYDEAQVFREQYMDALRMIEASKTGLLPQGYPIIGR